MENRLNAASYQSSFLLFVLILSLSLGLGVVAICAAGFSFATFFLEVTILTPPNSRFHFFHDVNHLASVLGAYLLVADGSLNKCDDFQYKLIRKPIKIYQVGSLFQASTP
jgi:hypothetical protein